MSAERIATIREWVTEVLAQPATVLELRSAMMERRVRVWDLPGNATQGADAEGFAGKLAEEINRGAERDGKLRNAVDVGYLVVALRAAADTQWINSLSFEVPGKGARKPGDTGGELEGASALGVLAQNMRQNENMHRMMLSSNDSRELGWQRQNELLQAELAAERAKVKQMDADRTKWILLGEKLLQDDLDRKLQLREMELKERKNKMLEEKFENLWPIAMNRLTGGGPGKGAPIFGEQLVMQLFGSFKPGQLPRLIAAAGFDETQAGLAFEIYRSYSERFAAQQEAKEAATRGHAEPAGDGGDHGTNGTSGPAKPEGDPPS